MAEEVGMEVGKGNIVGRARIGDLVQELRGQSVIQSVGVVIPLTFWKSERDMQARLCRDTMRE